MNGVEVQDPQDPVRERLRALTRQRVGQLRARGIEGDDLKESLRIELTNHVRNNTPDVLRYLQEGGDLPDLDQPIDLNRAVPEGEFERSGSGVVQAFQDYLIDPAWGAGAQFVQSGFVDPLAGLGIIPRINVKTDFRALVRKAAGVVGLEADKPLSQLAREELRREAFQEETGGAGSGLVRGVGRFVGGAGALFAGGGKFTPAGWTLRAGQEVAKKVVGQHGPKWLPRVLGASGGFAALEAMDPPDGWERHEAAAMGAVAGPVFEAFGEMGRRVFGKLMTDYAKKAISKDGQAALEAMNKWAHANSEKLGGATSRLDYLAKLRNAFVDAGMPGVKMPWAKFKAHAARAGIEGAGFSSIDDEFRESVFKALHDGDGQAALRAMETWLSNSLGVAFLHTRMNLKDIRFWQRNQPPPPPQEPRQIGGPSAPQGPAAPPGTKQIPQFAEGLHEKAAGEFARQREAQEAGGPQPEGSTDVLAQQADARRAAGARDPQIQRQQEAQRTLEEAQRPQDVTDWGTGSVGPGSLIQHPNLLRLGWRETDPPQEPVRLPPPEPEITEGGVPIYKQPVDLPTEPIPPKPTAEAPAEPRTEPVAAEPELPVERPTRRVEITDSPYFYDEIGADAVPSPKLRQALALPERLPVAELLPALERASLVSALQSKALLPGTEVTAEGVHAEPAKGTAPGRLTAIRLGELIQRPLAPVGKWRPAEKVDVRQPDQISPQQQQVVQALGQIRAMRPDLFPEFEGMLDAVTLALSRVAAEKDPAVMEAMQYAPQLIQALAQAPRELAGQALTSFAALLTTTSPQMMAQEAVVAQQQPAQAPTPLTGFGQEFGTVREAFEFLTDDRSHGDEIVAQVAPVVAEEMLGPEVTEALERGKPAAIKETKETVQQFTAEVERRAEEIRQRPTEAGSGTVIKEVAALAGRALDLGFDVISPYHRSLIDVVDKKGQPKLADMGGQWVSEFKALRGRWNARAAEVQRATRADREMRADIEALVPTKADGGWVRAGQVYLDGNVRKAYGEIAPSLSLEAREHLDKVHDITVDVMRAGEEAGMRKAETGDPLKADPGVWRQVQIPTPEAREAYFLQHGPAWDAWVQWNVKEFGLTPEAVASRFAEGRGLISRDPIELTRRFPYQPSVLQVGKRKVVWMETRPHEYLNGMLDHAAARIAFVKVFGQDVPDYKVPADSAVGDVPPVPARHLVDQAPKEAQQSIANMLRAMSGVPLEPKPLFGASPGSIWYEVQRIYESLMSLSVAGKLTFSAPIVNIPEIVGAPAAFLGVGPMQRAVAKVIEEFAHGRGRALMERLSQEGITTIEIEPFRVTGDGWLESFHQMAKSAAAGMREGMKQVQEISEAATALGLSEAVDLMREGKSLPQYRALVDMMHFSPERTDAILAGEGTEAEYQRIKRTGIGLLMGGTTQTGAEKSRAAHSRTFRSLVRYTDFFQASMRQMERLREGFRKAETQKQRNEAFSAFWKFLLGKGLSGIIAQNLVRLLTDGGEGVVQWWREAHNDWLEALENVMVAALFGGPGSAIWEAGEVAIETGSVRDILQKISRVIYPLGPIQNVADFTTSMVGTPGPENPYAQDQTAMQKLSRFVRTEVSAAREIHKGLFGQAALALGDVDPALDEAVEASARWKRENRPMGQPDPVAEEDLAFRVAMRQAMAELRRGGNMGKPAFKAAIRTAFKESEHGGKSVAASLRNRKLLKDVENWPPELQKSYVKHMGSEKLRRLAAFDDMLEILAKEFGGY